MMLVRPRASKIKSLSKRLFIGPDLYSAGGERNPKYDLDGNCPFIIIEGDAGPAIVSIESGAKIDLETR